MRNGTYLFVDGGHLRKHYEAATQAWFGENVPLDFKRLKAKFNADKCFYYDCLDNVQRPSEDDAQFKHRVAQQEAYFNAIQQVFATHVRLGALVGTGKRMRQKEVDILLAVDMLNHAVRGNMASAVLLTGDRDFKPVVESLVQHGLFITVAGDSRHTSRELRHAADGYVPLQFPDYFALAPEKQQKQMPLPYWTDISPEMKKVTDADLLKRGTVAEHPAELCQWSGNFIVYIEHSDRITLVRSDNYDRLMLFCELQFGKTQWDE